MSSKDILAFESFRKSHQKVTTHSLLLAVNQGQEIQKIPHRDNHVKLPRKSDYFISALTKNFGPFYYFSSTYERVRMKSDAIWRYQQYLLAYEYYQRPCLVPPLSIVVNIYNFLKWLLKYVLVFICRIEVTGKSFQLFVALT